METILLLVIFGLFGYPAYKKGIHSNIRRTMWVPIAFGITFYLLHYTQAIRSERELGVKLSNRPLFALKMALSTLRDSVVYLTLSVGSVIIWFGPRNILTVIEQLFYGEPIVMALTAGMFTSVGAAFGIADRPKLTLVILAAIAVVGVLGLRFIRSRQK